MGRCVDVICYKRITDEYKWALFLRKLKKYFKASYADNCDDCWYEFNLDLDDFNLFQTILLKPIFEKILFEKIPCEDLGKLIFEFADIKFETKNPFLKQFDKSNLKYLELSDKYCSYNQQGAFEYEFKTLNKQQLSDLMKNDEQIQELVKKNDIDAEKLQFKRFETTPWYYIYWKESIPLFGRYFTSIGAKVRSNKNAYDFMAGIYDLFEEFFPGHTYWFDDYLTEDEDTFDNCLYYYDECPNFYDLLIERKDPRIYDYCYQCKKKYQKYIFCQICHLAKYCSKECQQQHNQQHNQFCCSNDDDSESEFEEEESSYEDP